MADPLATKSKIDATKELINSTYFEVFHDLFRAYDVDNNGILMAAEVEEALHELGVCPTPMELKKLLALVDDSPAGAALDINEWVLLMVHLISRPVNQTSVLASLETLMPGSSQIQQEGWQTSFALLNEYDVPADTAQAFTDSMFEGLPDDSGGFLAFSVLAVALAQPVRIVQVYAHCPMIVWGATKIQTKYRGLVARRLASAKKISTARRVGKLLGRGFAAATGPKSPLSVRAVPDARADVPPDASCCDPCL
jgi:hypothetical protein